jgi:hypothetical protein
VNDAGAEAGILGGFEDTVTPATSNDFAFTILCGSAPPTPFKLALRRRDDEFGSAALRREQISYAGWYAARVQAPDNSFPSATYWLISLRISDRGSIAVNSSAICLARKR